MSVRNRLYNQDSIRRTPTTRASTGADQIPRSSFVSLAERRCLQELRKRASSCANLIASEKPTSGRTLGQKQRTFGDKLVPIRLWLHRRRHRCTRPRSKIFPQQPGLYIASHLGRRTILGLS